MILRECKLSNGSPNFPVLFSIPSNQRLPAMATEDYEGTVDVAVALVTMSVASMNLKRQMTPDQINDLAETIVETSYEDNLSLEDVLLFVQRLIRGQYGEMYESMDIPKFMEKLEIYRQERHEEIVKLRDNQHLHYKSLGDPERTTSPGSAFEEHLNAYATKLREKNDEIKELRADRKRKHQ